MALSPWPTTPAALTAATATLRVALNVSDNSENPDDNATLQRLGVIASALVERYASNAPEVVKDEAVIRCAGWLWGAPSDGLRRETTGPFTASWSPTMTGAFRNSGAMVLLSPWKVRRAGVIG